MIGVGDALVGSFHGWYHHDSVLCPRLAERKRPVRLLDAAREAILVATTPASVVSRGWRREHGTIPSLGAATGASSSSLATISINPALMDDCCGLRCAMRQGAGGGGEA